MSYASLVKHNKTAPVRVDPIGGIRYEVQLPKLAYNRNVECTAEERKEYSVWLCSGMWFAMHLYMDGDTLDEFIEEIVDRSGVSKKRYLGTRVEDAIRGILANLYLAYINERAVKMISFRYMCKGVGRKGIPYTPTRVKRIVDYLVKEGYARYIRGICTPEGVKKGPKMWLTEKGYNRLFECNIEINIEARGNNLPLARLFMDGELVDMDDESIDPELREVLKADERFLRALNKFISSHKITIEVDERNHSPFAKRMRELEKQLYIRRLEGYDIGIAEALEGSSSYAAWAEGWNGVHVYELLHRDTTRVYARGQHIMGGRFYNGSHLSLPSYIRRYIKIDSMPTVELDFCSLHISMLYHLEDLPVPDNPYIYPSGDWRRDIIKRVALVAINAVSRRQALGYINGWLRGKGLDGLSGAAFLDEFLSHNKPIQKYICSDIGVRLQKYDSDIMKDILKNLMELKIPALPVHDSIIVQERYEHVAYNIMKKCYMKHMGRDIKISKK